MTRRTVAGVVTALLAAAAGAAPTAMAGTVFQIGDGGWPAVAVGPDRTTHVVWVEPERAAGVDVVRYCRFAESDRRCSAPMDLAPPPGAGAEVLRRPHVFALDAGRVIVSERRQGGSGSNPGVYVRVSTDGGNTFSAPTKLAYVIPHDNVLLGPGASLSGVSGSTFGNVAFNAGAPGSAPTSVALGSGFAADGDLALADGAPLVAWWQDGSPDAIYFRRYAGSDTTSASLHNADNWSAAVAVDTTNPGGGLMLAGGAGGLYLAHLDAAADGSEAVRVHAYRNLTFDQGTVISRSGHDVAWFAIAQDPQGNLHAAWEAPGGFYWRTLSGGTWGPERLICVCTFMRQARVAPLGPFFGRVLWTPANSADGFVRGATSLDAPCSGVDDPRPGCEPPRCELERRCLADNWRVNGTKIKLVVRRDEGSCAQRNVKARLKVKQGGRGSARVTRVVFRLAGAGRKKDESAPWSGPFDVPDPIPGARRRVFAKAHMKVAGTVQRFNMSKPFVVCDTT
jgi:hypothetical protein